MRSQFATPSLRPSRSQSRPRKAPTPPAGSAGALPPCHSTQSVRSCQTRALRPRWTKFPAAQNNPAPPAARCSDRFWLYSSLPTLSVWPSMATCRLGYASTIPETLASRSRAPGSNSKLPLRNSTSDIFAISPRAESRVARIEFSCCSSRARKSCFSFSACCRRLSDCAAAARALSVSAASTCCCATASALAFSASSFWRAGFLRRGHSFCLHALGFSLGLFGLGTGLFRLSLSRFRIRATLGFRRCIRARFGFTRRSRGLRFVFRLLFHRHQPRFLCGLGGFLGRGFHRCLVLLLPVDFFRVHQLLPSLRKNRRRVFIRCRNMRDAHRVPRLKQFQRSLAVDPENRILNVRVGRRIRAPRHQFILRVDELRRRRRSPKRSPSPPCCPAASPQNRARP